MPVLYKSKTMTQKFLCVIYLLCFNVTLLNATNIKGQVEIDNTWESLIYLSGINSFDDLNTASYDFLIARTEIDTSGFFEFENLDLHAKERLYRLHICKVGDPVSTIIIGGNEENFIHFIMKNGDSIEVNVNPESSHFYNSLFSGNPANKNLRLLFQWQKKLNSPPSLPTIQNRQLLREKVLDDYYNFADTSSYTIIQLLSIYLMNETFSAPGHLKLMERVQTKVQDSDTSSPYYKAFSNELSYLKYHVKRQSRTKTIWVIVIAFLLVIVSIFIPKLIQKKGSNRDLENGISELINQLSIQEKRVLDLLKEGKTNKEISNELHIEVSTVKSHLNKIYSRLGVSGRKDIINSDWQK